MKKRILSLLLCLFLCVSLLPVYILAEDDESLTGNIAEAAEELASDEHVWDGVPDELPERSAKKSMHWEEPEGTDLPSLRSVAGIPIDEEHFEDEQFRTFVSERFDTVKDDILSDSEIAAVTGIGCMNRNIASLQGVEYFTNLISLWCSGNRLTELDVSQNTALTELDCGSNLLTSLNVSGCTAMENLMCYDNRLTSLNLSGCTALEALACFDNQLEELDVSANTQLTSLNCCNNRLEELDVNANTQLRSLICNQNRLTSLNLSGSSSLTSLACHGNALTTLNVQNCPALRDLLLSPDTVSHEEGYTVYIKTVNGVRRDLSMDDNVTITEGAPTITTQPTNKSVTAGTNATFSVKATDAASYQWQYWSTNSWKWYNVTASDINGAKTATMTVPGTTARNGMKYRCQVKNSGGTTNSDSATLTVTSVSKPTITTQPTNKSVTAGKNATFSVTAAGATSYQWQYWSTNSWKWYNVTASDISGAKSAMMTVPGTTARNGMKYRCAVTNSAGTTNSDSVTLTVTSASKPTITTQPTNKSVTAGTNAAFSVMATGATGYQWQYWSTNSSKWYNVTASDISGAKTTMMTVPGTTARNGIKYRCAVTNANGTTYSSTAVLTVTSTSNPTITKQPSNVTVEAGSYATFSVTATDAVSYQWKYDSTNLSTWENLTASDVTGANTATLTVPATTDRNGLRILCAVTNSKGTTWSNWVMLTVTTSSMPAITTQPGNVSAELGSYATFSVKATGATSYQWQYFNPSTMSKWQNVTDSSYGGVRTAKMTVPVTTERNGLMFRCIVISSDNGMVYSRAATLLVKPGITTQPSSVTTTAGRSAKFSVTASGPADLRYQWQYWSSGNQKWVNVTADDISGAITATMTVPATTARNGVKYRCLVWNAGGTANSDSATLTVRNLSKPTITAQPSNKTVRDGTNATFSVTATGATSFQWQYWSDSYQKWVNVTAGDISGAKTATMTVPGTTARNGIQYRCAVMNSDGATYSNSATLTVTAS